MAKARSITCFDFVLEGDRALPPAEQTTWKLKTLGVTEVEQLVGVRSEEGAEITVTHHNPLTMARKALNLGLLGWENFPCPDGTQTEFRATGVGVLRRIPDEILNLISPKDAVELGTEIILRSKLEESTAKNS